jgi:hypothetical protein
MMWTPWSELRVRAAALFATVAIMLAVVSAATAFRADDVMPTPPLGAAPDATQQPERRNVPVSALVALDPFGLSDPGAIATESAPIVPPPPIILVGTIIGVEQPAAACRLGTAPVRILHVGDTLGGWRLAQVAPGRVVFIDAGGARQELRLSPLGN